MPGPMTIYGRWEQTKVFAVRRGFFGHVILQVEEKRKYGKSYGEGIVGDNYEYRWRDAKLGDWIEYGFRN